MLDLDLERTCFVTFYTKTINRRIYMGKEIHFRTGIISNAFSYIYPYLKDISSFYLVEYNNDNLVRLKKDLNNFKHIICSIFYTDILNNPNFRNLLDQRFILGGPGIELSTFYNYSNIPNYVKILPGKCISQEVLGFVSNRFSTYWDKKFSSQFDIYTFCVPTNVYFCEKSIKYGPCSFCNYTPLFMKKTVFRNSTRKIESLVDDVLKSLKPAKKITTAHFAGQTYNINMLKKLYNLIYEKKRLILETNLFFVVYSLFTECDKFLDFISYDDLHHRIAFSISFESFLDQDLKMMNKRYFNISYGIKVVEKLLRKGFSFITSLIINHSDQLDFNEDYVTGYLENWRKFVDIIDRNCNDHQLIRVFINPIFISKNSYANSNLQDQKIYLRFNSLISKIFDICRDSKIMINFYDFK